MFRVFHSSTDSSATNSSEYFDMEQEMTAPPGSSNAGAIDGLAATMARLADQMNQLDDRNRRHLDQMHQETQQLSAALTSRLDQLEQRQSVATPLTTPAQAPTPTPTAPNEPTKIHGKLVEFSGDRSVFRAWRDQVEIKISDDYAHCTESVKYGGVYQCLRGAAATLISSWARTQPAHMKTWSNIVTQLAYAYDDPDLQANAVNKLQRFRQGNRSVNAFVSELMTLLVDAGVHDDTQKKLYLTKGLRDVHKRKVDFSPWVFREADFNRCVELCRSFDLQDNFPNPNPAANEVDTMDWTPTAAAGQWRGRGPAPQWRGQAPREDRHGPAPQWRGQAPQWRGQGRPQDQPPQGEPPQAPRARWVNRDELLRRRNLYIRCGTTEHFYQECPFRAAQPPSNSNGYGSNNGARGRNSGGFSDWSRPFVAPVTDEPPVRSLMAAAAPPASDPSENA